MNINNEELFGMIDHWLNTPENGYLGSSQGGRNLAEAAQEGSVNDESNREFMAKLRTDIPALAGLSLEVVKSTNAIIFTLRGDSKTYSL
jgi:hypothetical protein